MSIEKLYVRLKNYDIMKKLLIPFLFVLCCSFSLQTDSMLDECQQSKVWICSNSACYHKTSSCMEIRNCSKKQTTLDVAQKQGKKACPVCYPQKNTKKSSSSQATKAKKSTTTNNSTTNQATKTKTTTNSSTKSQATKTKKTN